jgi:hypothetical protein
MEPPITAVVRRVIVILRQEILESLSWRLYRIYLLRRPLS